MSFVLDCSMTLAWVFADEASASTEALRESLLTESAIVPVLWPVEVGNVLLVALRRGRITEDDRARIRDDLLALPINIEPVSCDRVWDAVLSVANERNLSVYDAMYLELALRLKLPLATLDKSLAAAGKAAGVEVI